MEIDHLRQILDDVKSGVRTVEQATELLGSAPDGDLGFAQLDLHRELRNGFPEVIYGEGKQATQIVEILRRLGAAGQDGLVTRVDEAKAQAILDALPDAVWYPLPRIIQRRANPERPLPSIGRIAVVSAGTSDLAVAEEAALVAEALGNNVDRIWDVGVAGLHRLMGRLERLRQARALIVVAGMEGALASVVAGLVRRPVIAVPTSVGYGASFHGLSALLGMLNACAAGVSVVNIDNGFGAAAQASLINQCTTP